MGKYDFSSYSGSGDDIQDTVSGNMGKLGSGAQAPIWESGEMKFKTGDEYIQLVDFILHFDNLPLYMSSSVTVNIWIKLQKAPTSIAYIFRCNLQGQQVRFQSIPQS